MTWIVHLEFSAIISVASRVALALARCSSSSIRRVGQLARPLFIAAPELHSWRPSQERMPQKYFMKG